MFVHYHAGNRRRYTVLSLESLEDRAAPAAIAAVPVISLPPSQVVQVLAQPATTAPAGVTVGVQQGSPGIASSTTASTTLGVGAPATPTLAASAILPTGTASALSASTAVPAQFGFADLPGGPVNTTPGGSSGVLDSGALVTNGTAGLPPGGIISVSPEEAVTSLNVLFGVRGLATRTLFPVTQAVGGSREAPAPAPNPGSPAANPGVQVPGSDVVPPLQQDTAIPATTPSDILPAPMEMDVLEDVARMLAVVD